MSELQPVPHPKSEPTSLQPQPQISILGQPGLNEVQLNHNVNEMQSHVMMNGGQMMGGEHEIPITLLGNLPLMYQPDDKKEFLGELPCLILDYGIRHWDARSRLVEEFGSFYHVPPPFMFRYQLRLFLNELETWVHNDEAPLLIERVIILEQCCEIYHNRGQLVDLTNIMRAYIEQLVISPLYFSEGKDFVDSTCVMYLDESGGPPVLFKWRLVVQDVIRNLIDGFSQTGGEGLKKNFPKHVCYNRIMEYLDPILKEFLYQESHIEKIMKEYHMLKDIVLNNNNKAKLKKRSKPKKRNWNDDKDRDVVKKIKRLGASSSEEDQQGSSDSSDNIIPKKHKGRRPRVFWSDEEEQMLIKGVAKYGVGNWVSIHRRYNDKFHDQRTPSDLKDKWRNLQNKKKRKSVDTELEKQQHIEQQRKIEQQQLDQQRLIYEHQQEIMLQQQQLDQHIHEQMTEQGENQPAMDNMETEENVI